MVQQGNSGVWAVQWGILDCGGSVGNGGLGVAGKKVGSKKWVQWISEYEHGYDTFRHCRNVRGYCQLLKFYSVLFI